MDLRCDNNNFGKILCLDRIINRKLYTRAAYFNSYDSKYFFVMVLGKKKYDLRTFIDDRK